MNGSVRSRIEAAQYAERYATRLAPSQPNQKTEDERQQTLLQNAKKIAEGRVQVLLVEMDSAEREVCYDIIARETPQALGKPTVLEATLLRVREQGTSAIREVMTGASREEKELVGNILMTATSSEMLGMDGGRKCKEMLDQVRHQRFMNEGE